MELFILKVIHDFSKLRGSWNFLFGERIQTLLVWRFEIAGRINEKISRIFFMFLIYIVLIFAFKLSCSCQFYFINIYFIYFFATLLIAFNKLYLLLSFVLFIIFSSWLIFHHLGFFIAILSQFLAGILLMRPIALWWPVQLLDGLACYNVPVLQWLFCSFFKFSTLLLYIIFCMLI